MLISTNVQTCTKLTETMKSQTIIFEIPNKRFLPETCKFLILVKFTKSKNGIDKQLNELTKRFYHLGPLRDWGSKDLHFTWLVQVLQLVEHWLVVVDEGGESLSLLTSRLIVQFLDHISHRILQLEQIESVLQKKKTKLIFIFFKLAHFCYKYFLVHISTSDKIIFVIHTW